MMRHPIQPLESDVHGVTRFKRNSIVCFLLDVCRDRKILDLNDLAHMAFAEEDWEQFSQLTGYSICGFLDLSYVSDETRRAVEELDERFQQRRQRRDDETTTATLGNHRAG